mmetsp:Transcript_7665/g.11138  ORF Transcript_7665/g.11138 Transcript_7665/m.11138 type:complete len:543 (-) Transcript_7665:28-1656(-)
MSNTGSSKKGKNGFVARKLSEALSTFLEIDESLVKSRLLNPTKSKITLHDIKVKPRIIYENADLRMELSGNIEKIQFKWRWNYFNTSKTYKGIMKKTALLVKGAKIYLKPISKSNAVDTSISTESPVTDLKKQPKLVQHIIEQFSIHFDDIEVHIEVPSNEWDTPSTTFVTRAVGLELDPVGYYKKMKKKNIIKRKQDTSKVQELRVASLSVRVLEKDRQGKVATHWFIEPFQYSALVRRFHGERFSGFDTGLEVIGQDGPKSKEPFPIIPLSATPSKRSSSSTEDGDDNSIIAEPSSDVAVHIETDEVEAILCRDMQQLADQLWNDSNIKAKDRIRMIFRDVQSKALSNVIKLITTNNIDGEIKAEVLDEKHYPVPSALLSAPLAAISPHFKKQDVNKSSIFHFPVPYLEAVLPNSANVVARDCVFNYRTDGSLNLFESKGGVSINDKRLLEEGSSLAIDAKGNDIILRPQQHKHEHDTRAGISDFLLDMNSIGLVKEGAEKLADSLFLAKESQMSKVNSLKLEKEEWSLKIQGTTEIKLS